MKVHRSALKHGISSEDAIQAVVLALENGDEMVIHAMPARKKYLDLLP